MYSTEKRMVKVHSKKRSNPPQADRIDSTLSSITTVTLNPIAISRATSNIFPPRVPLSKMMR